MSIYSGKCDLCDHISGMGGWFNKDGKPVKIGDPDTHVYYSDELLDFIAFKKATGGVIYQHKHLKVDIFNQDLIAEKCPQFKIIEHVEKVKDKRLKQGYREDINYTYEYFGKEYSLKEINKQGVYITVEIRFNTLLDLIPYYPHIVSMANCQGGKQTIYISNESFVESEYEKHLQHGWESGLVTHYRRELQDHYREVVLRYFNPQGREAIEEVCFDENHQAHTKFKIDPNFPIQWDWESKERKLCWCLPKMIDDTTIEITEADYNTLSKHSAKIVYIKYKEYPLYLK